MASPAAGEAGSVELVVVTMRFDAADATRVGTLIGVLSRYVVLTRMKAGCRNVDFCASATRPGRLLVIEKWESPAAQRVHFDSPTMVEMATSCAGLMAVPPDVDLWDAASAHDLI